MTNDFRLRSSLEEALRDIPLLLDAYRSTIPLVEPHLDPRGLDRWTREVAALAGGLDDQDAGEALSALLQAAPAVAAGAQSRDFLRWARLGRQVLKGAPQAAAAYLRASPHVLSIIGPGKLAAWVAQAQRLYQGKSDGQELAAEFFQQSPQLFAAASFRDIERLVDLLALIPPRPSVMARTALKAAANALPMLEARARRHSLEVGSSIAAANPWAVGLYFETSLRLLPRLEEEGRAAFLDSLAQLGGLSPLQLSGFFKEAAAIPASLTAQQLGHLLPLTARVSTRSPVAALELLHSAPDLFRRLAPEQLEEWCQHGEDLLSIHQGAALSYFRLQSRQAQNVLASVSSGVTLAEVRDVLRMYCQALMGRTLTLLTTEELQEQPGGWVADDTLDWEGPAIFAPSLIQDFPSKQTNFEAYKVVATHQAGHLAFGTYDFSFEGEGVVFRPLRHRMTPPSEPGQPYTAEFDRFFNLFSDRRLARDLFTLAEDERIDALIYQEYRGIRGPYRRVQDHSLAQRPALKALPLRSYFMELLVRHSLRRNATCRAPRAFRTQLETGARILNLLGDTPVTPEDVAEATMRLYILLGHVPNLPSKAIPPEQWIEIAMPNEHYDPDTENLDELAQAFARLNPLDLPFPGDRPAPDGDEEQPFFPTPPVPYRLDPKPEAMQALLQLLEEGDSSGEGQPVDQVPMDLLQEMVEQEDAAPSDAMGQWEAAEPSPNPEPSLRLDQTGGTRQSSPIVESVAEQEVQVFRYDEWDYRIRAYRPGWCQLYQRTLKEGSEEFYEKTLEQHPGLVHAIRKQFEMLRPDGMSRVKRLIDGEEFDLDAVVDSVVDKRAGDGLKDKVYWRRRKTERNVAIALLLDMSLSTDERVDQDVRFFSARHLADVTPTAPFRPRRAGIGKRIIDLEKESLVLFTEALEQLGDTYGIYGFSSSGRGDVQFFVIKDMEEVYSPQVKGRINKIVPLQGTRMGTAIRHTSAKLLQQEARTKVLLLLSDGRPQDRDYGTLPWELEEPHRERYRPLDTAQGLLGPDGVMTDEKTYAVHDTKTALNEAKAKGLTPFCLSIDKEGHDYLKAMCGDIGYEVVSDIESLPRRVPALYRRLTT